MSQTGQIMWMRASSKPQRTSPTPHTGVQLFWVKRWQCMKTISLFHFTRQSGGQFYQAKTVNTHSSWIWMQSKSKKWGRPGNEVTWTWFPWPPISCVSHLEMPTVVWSFCVLVGHCAILFQWWLVCTLDAELNIACKHSKLPSCQTYPRCLQKAHSTSKSAEPF